MLNYFHALRAGYFFSYSPGPLLAQRQDDKNKDPSVSRGAKLSFPFPGLALPCDRLKIVKMIPRAWRSVLLFLPFLPCGKLQIVKSYPRFAQCVLRFPPLFPVRRFPAAGWK